MLITRLAWLVLGVITVVTPSPARGQWPTDPGPTGLLLYPNSSPQHRSAPDGTGGMVLGLAQYSGSNTVQGVVLQRVDAHGNLPWSSSGVQVGYVGLLMSNIYIPDMEADGAGGVFALFYDFQGQSFDLVAKHVGSDGASIWPGGRAVLAPGFGSGKSWISRDGTGGCIAVWRTSTPYPYPHYAQRVDAAGNLLWATGGVALGFETLDQAAFAPDGAGGFFAAWSQAGAADYEIYAQHYAASGAPLWAANGIPVCVAAGDQGSGTPGIVAISDGAGGVCLAWIDRRDDSGGDLYAQRIDGSGGALWTPGGVPLCAVEGAQHHPVPVADGTGGVVVVWQDERNGSSNLDLFCQKVDGGGTVRWTAGGAVVCNAIGNQNGQGVSSDGFSGVFVAWQDLRDASSATDIFVQHMDACGAPRGAPEGVFVGSTCFDLCCPSVVPNAGGATVAWNAGREVRGRHVPAASLQVGVEAGPAAFALLGCVPNPSVGEIGVRFSLAEGGPFRLEVLDVAGRRVWTRDESGLGPGNHVLPIGKMPAGVYLVRLRQRNLTAETKAVFLR